MSERRAVEYSGRGVRMDGEIHGRIGSLMIRH